MVSGALIDMTYLYYAEIKLLKTELKKASPKRLDPLI